MQIHYVFKLVIMQFANAQLVIIRLVTLSQRGVHFVRKVIFAKATEFISCI
jgi:hypothetical protein